jgi:hypothetical protein
MGLILFACLIFAGFRGAPIRRAATYCIITAVVLTIISIGAMDDPLCYVTGCSFSIPHLALVFVATVALGVLCIACGAGIRRLVHTTA